MSGLPNKPGQRGTNNAPPEKITEAMSLESLLSDIEAEESKVAEQFPGITDALDDEFDGLDDFDDLDDLDDFDDFDDLDDFDDFDDHENEQGNKNREDESAHEVGSDFLTDAEDFDDAPVGIEETKPDLSSEDGSDDGEEDFFGVGNTSSGKSLTELLKDKSRLYPVLIIALLVIVIIILLMNNCGGAAKKQDPNDWYDMSAIEGTLPGKTPEEIQAMLDQIVEEGMFNISIAPVIVFENAQAEGQARIENVPANHYNMSVEITLDDTSETIYQSKGIRPGQYIEYITLQKKLQPGEYEATAVFTAHDPENFSEQGRVAVKITIIVE